MGPTSKQPRDRLLEPDSKGDRAENVEEAIGRFEAALTVITREADPDRWAAAQNNLANAFGKRLRGEQADNRDMAIAHIEAALSVFSRDSHPEQWAQAQNNLAIAYLDRMRGDVAEIRRRPSRVCRRLSPCLRPSQRRSYGPRLSTTWEKCMPTAFAASGPATGNRQSRASNRH